MKIAIINGPNLNLLSKREPEIYGHTTFEDYLEVLQSAFPKIELIYFQSNHEGELIDYLHKIGFDFDGIVLNAGAYTHTSVAIADAISAITTPVLEVHISNVFKRSRIRQHSYLSPVVRGIITGFGLDSYKLAIYSFVNA